MARVSVNRRRPDVTLMVVVVENLRLNDIRLQSDKSLSEFFAPLTTVPSLQIGVVLSDGPSLRDRAGQSPILTC